MFSDVTMPQKGRKEKDLLDAAYPSLKHFFKLNSDEQYYDDGACRKHVDYSPMICPSICEKPPTSSVYTHYIENGHGISKNTQSNSKTFQQELQETDVANGRTTYFKNHVGNVILRQLVASKAGEYAAAGKTSKSKVISSVLQKCGRFMKEDCMTGKWIEIDHAMAREKVAQEFRNALHIKYRSSFKSKKRMREMKKEQLDRSGIKAFKINMVSSMVSSQEGSHNTERCEFELQPTRQNDSLGECDERKSTLNGANPYDVDDSFDTILNSMNFDGVANSSCLHECL